MKRWDKVKLVISDCHLSAGRFYESKLNPHEDFHFDDEMCDMFNYFSTGPFGEVDGQSIDVELVIAGDYLDFLNVPIMGEFEDAITEENALKKLHAIMNGHPHVMAALKRFAGLPGKTITYLIGNHDAELFFPKVAEAIVRAWDPQGRFPSEKVKVVNDRDRLEYEEGFEIRHGNQEESGNELDFEEPLVKTDDGRQVLNIPWGSVYVLKIINRLKWEREYLDKIRPIRVFFVFGLFFDTWFTIRFGLLSFFYFIRTRLLANPVKRFSLKRMWQRYREESAFFLDLERSARRMLDENPKIKTIIMGHTHRPMNKVYPDGKQYINTGTWTKMIDLDWRGLGQQFRRTFALVLVKDGQAVCDLRQWMGEHSPHKIFQG